MTPSPRLRDLRRMALAAALALPLAVPGRAATTDVPPEIAAFDDFILIASPLCRAAPAAQCIDFGWRFADSDADDHLSLAEAEALHRLFEDWAEWKKPQMDKREQAVLAISRLALRLVDIEGMVEGYDTDGDALLTREELLVDVTLDERPLPEILTDREATDWAAIGKRMGPAAVFLGALGAPTN